jgi:microcystin-dependent protein
MSATSTKCTVSFNSNETNETTPIAYTKEELIALNEEIKNTAYEKIKAQLLNDTYPVGSIYMSTEDDTVEKVENKFGGTWVKYSEGTTLIGANSTYAVNTTGGSSTVTLSTSNLPSHSHVIPELTVSSWSGSHSHTLTGPSSYAQHLGQGSSGNYGWVAANTGATITTSSKKITVSGQTTTESETTTCTDCSGTSFSIQNPYTAVYIYKRTA